jgi:pyridoxal phosphate enzyme (YggS family)
MTENVDLPVSSDDVVGVKARLASVTNRIASLKKEGNLSQSVRLVAESNTKPCGLIRACVEAGHLHFGENYIQELVAKAPLCPPEIQWHFIGHLQSNKVKKLLEVPNLWAIETVDSEKVARMISVNIHPPRPPLNIFIQANTSGEESKSGLSAGEAVALAETISNDKTGAYSNIRLVGFMTIGKLGGDATEDFKALSDIRRKAAEKLKVPEASFELSMGMSSDYDVAMKLGSTNVRVGSTIFGERDYHK